MDVIKREQKIKNKEHIGAETVGDNIGIWNLTIGREPWNDDNHILKKW